VLAYLKGQPAQALSASNYPQTTTARITWKSPYPILRHHFGLPTMEATIDGLQKIAEAQALDLISLGTDQDAQENFFHPERQDPRRRGAGGVPVGTPDDFRALYAASRRGNFPLLRAYSGTDDFIRYAELRCKRMWYGQHHSPGQLYPQNRLLRRGHTVEKLGLEQWSVSELTRFVKEGVIE
jgi:hypothetical protein